MGKNDQAKNGVELSNFSVYDRPLDAARREVSIGRVFVRIPDLTPIFAFIGGI